jgi:hypothetical protein
MTPVALVLAALTFANASAAAHGGQERKPTMEDTNKAVELVRQQFPILSRQGMPPVNPITDHAVTQAFPRRQILAVIFRQHPVARLTPAPLAAQNLFVVAADDKVWHVTDTGGLEDLFRKTPPAVTNEAAARDKVEAWLRLRQELMQDGFYKFAIPAESLSAERAGGGWSAAGKAVVTQGGKGEIHAVLTFSVDGKLTRVDETSTVKAGVRPICQATKLLDPDAIVRQMAEKDILVMGRAVKEYLDEQRAQASPELQQAIDRVWQRLLREGW